jgi:hypothetical protein
MNYWDLFTSFSSIALGLSAVVIFGFFLRDAGELINPSSREKKED